MTRRRVNTQPPLYSGWWQRPPASTVLGVLQTRPDAARFVGGCVRDTLLGRPFSEIDIATVHHPHHTASLLEAAGLTVKPIGLSHGTVLTAVHGTRFDITTLRCDLETDGRRAVVGFTDSWTEDARRRDLTINALFLDADGIVHDPVGGRADLEAGRVRFVGDPDERVNEDVLRILRFYRFSAYLARTPLDEGARRACAAAAPRLHSLSQERISAEFLKLLAAPGVLDVLDAMAQDGVLGQLLPPEPRSRALARLIELEQRTGPDPIRRLAVLANASRVPDRFRLSGAQQRRFERIQTHRIGPGLSGQDLRTLLYRQGRRRVEDTALVSGAFDQLPGEEVERILALANAWTPPSFPLTGRDLVRMGMASGPRVGALLRHLEKRWIDGGFTGGRTTCLAWAREAVGDIDAAGS